MAKKRRGSAEVLANRGKTDSSRFSVDSDELLGGGPGNGAISLENSSGDEMADTLEGSSVEGSGSEEELEASGSDLEETKAAVEEYIRGSSADGATDSSEDERPSRNTVGKVPLKWYEHEEHIGYDREGDKIVKSKRGDLLDQHLAKQDGGSAWRTIYDEYNDEEIVLSKEEVQMIQRIRAGRFPHVEVEPFPEYNDYFSRETEIHPVLNLPEPKRRFARSKWEEKKIVKLVRAMRKGWLKRKEESPPDDGSALYLMWDDDNKITEKTSVGLSYIPPPKPQLPGNELSYNPPQEYLPNEEERKQWEAADEEGRPKILPQSFDSLRKVPMYSDFIKERFERCLDLYLCPRSRKKRINIDPQSLVPQLPKPADLQPFPSTLCLEYVGHTGKVTSVTIDPTGHWMASGSADRSVKIWEVATGRCVQSFSFEHSVACVSWCPSRDVGLLAACSGNTLYLLATSARKLPKIKPFVILCVEHGVKRKGQEAEASNAGDAEGDNGSITWRKYGDGGFEIHHKFPLRDVVWHSRGDYFASVAPTGNTQAVTIHQLSKRQSQNPFRKNRGRVQRVQFHPSKPIFFVATENHVRVYNLAKQALVKKLISGSGVITSLSVHSGGDNVIVGCEDNRLLWFDMDLSTKPYRHLKYHKKAVRGVSFHRSYPLFASSSDDGTAQVFHGMVYSDLMTNPLIVPLKILRGHEVVDFEGVLACHFHPTQPWLFTAGGDSTVKLWCN